MLTKCLLVRISLIAPAGLFLQLQASFAQGESTPAKVMPQPTQTIIVNARLFDGRGAHLADGMNVLVVGNKIAKISRIAIAPPAGAVVVDAAGRTLMPVLIDMHIGRDRLVTNPAG
jgi:adenine deaminase